MRWLRRYWYVPVFVIVNLAIASPADAGLRTATCSGPEGEEFGCCKTCWVFCGCEFAE